MSIDLTLRRAPDRRWTMEAARAMFEIRLDVCHETPLGVTTKSRPLPHIPEARSSTDLHSQARQAPVLSPRFALSVLDTTTAPCRYGGPTARRRGGTRAQRGVRIHETARGRLRKVHTTPPCRAF